MKPILWIAAAFLLSLAPGTSASAAKRRVCVEVVIREATPPPARKRPAQTAPSQSRQAKPRQAKPRQAKPRQAKPRQAKPWAATPREPTTRRSDPNLHTKRIDDAGSPQKKTARFYAEKNKTPRRVLQRRPYRRRWFPSTKRYDLSQMPLGQTPATYLKRLLEHFVTHEPGFTAVNTTCEQTMRVELYPLRQGWTAFARYTGYGREEWVEQLLPDELSQFAERAVLALLHNQPISTTIKRDTVLRADTRIPKRWIGGTNHISVSLGTQLRIANVDRVQKDGTVDGQYRVFSPMTVGVGYRGKFENWAIESVANLGLEANRTAVRNNPSGGHVDMGGNAGLSVHFLRYFNPRGITSFYLGAGSRFEVLWFSVIRPDGMRASEARSTLASGGVDVDLVFGWEFMRATKIQWVIQGEVHLPAYVIDTANDYGSVNSWVPGASLALGVLF